MTKLLSKYLKSVTDSHFSNLSPLTNMNPHVFPPKCILTYTKTQCHKDFCQTFGNRSNN